ncbi:MAG TPA: DUF6160 family protein [Noviherbaspirillum sp.]|uniref:DUF6160 family protein n=1 Tax=Noviherbaspirillum sp. TaxID=1926288 RepID=UPI002B45A24B|nr:DUF6160 family protein [Noviherbaspirillum sp.]HJV86194.1 DUF6160 family protein [Noviherbaspirillum sp.]
MAAKPFSARTITRGVLALCCATAGAGAYALQPLNDATLSSVTGRDGLNFDLSNFALSGDARYTYFAPAPSTASAYIANPYLLRSDDTASPFGDPYHVEVVKGASGLADVINFMNPLNANGAKVWQAAFDWGVNAGGIAFDGGAMVFKDAVFYGGGMQWTTPRSSDGIAFGMSLRTDIGNVLLRPRGRGDITQAEPSTVAEQMNIRGVHIGAVDSNGNFLNTPWRIADAATQPGVFNAVTDTDGNPRLHIGIDWPDASGAALGGLKVDNVSFRSDVTGNLDLGSSRIGSMQIQYLDIKMRP